MSQSSFGIPHTSAVRRFAGGLRLTAKLGAAFSTAFIAALTAVTVGTSAAAQQLPPATAQDSSAASGAAKGAVRGAAKGADSTKGNRRVQGLDSLRIIGRFENLTGIASTASQGRIGVSDLRARPLSREGELLEAVPGMILTQHSGDGKANQMFVRGFNLDHGTDFATRVDGMPVNLPSHAHGQGYSDLNFLIPELVQSIDYRLGVYHAELGDFGSAGGANFQLLRRLDQPFAVASGGAYGFARLVAAGSQRVGNGDLLAGGEVKAYDGPWNIGEQLRKYSGLTRYSWQKGSSRFSLLGMAYNNRWRSSDQIPQRAVEAGRINRFGQIDSTLGGEAARYSLSGEWTRARGSTLDEVQLYGITSRFDLLSNFTYLLDDDTNGDQFNQHEQRLVTGINAKRRVAMSAGGVPQLFTIGLQGRLDQVSDIGLYRTRSRARVSTVREDDVRQLGAGLFVEAESRWNTRFRSVLGARLDGYRFRVIGDNTANSGSRSAAIASPKASFVYTPSERIEMYVSGGLGFHSNDARGTTITVDPVSGDPVPRVDPLVRSRGGELGFRLTPVEGFRSTLALWALGLDSELLFIGDGGATEASAGSRRRGVTWANFYRPRPELSFDTDVSFAHARFTGVDAGQRNIPGALENVVAAGVTWQVPVRGVFAAARVRHFGAYPLIEDNSTRATPTTLLNADVGYQFSSRVRVQVTLLNALNGRASDIQYFYNSRLPGENPAGVGDVHFHPVEPRQLRLSFGWGM